MQGHGLDDFLADSDAEIAGIAAFPHEHGETTRRVARDGDEDEGKDATSYYEGDG
jgi:hypothetical protein